MSEKKICPFQSDSQTDVDCSKEGCQLWVALRKPRLFTGRSTRLAERKTPNMSTSTRVVDWSAKSLGNWSKWRRKRMSNSQNGTDAGTKQGTGMGTGIGIKPDPTWKRLTADELIAEMDKMDERNMPREQFSVNLALLSLVREGRVVAYLLPNGEIRYQYAEGR